jgi:protein-disulfide isomerase
MNSHTVAMLAIPVSPQDHIRGPENAPVTVVEYGDFECPHCGEAYYVVKELEQSLADTARFVFRHFPLSTIHPDAELAAEAAQAAAAQGQFWPMHDILFENQSALAGENLVEYASAIGLDVEKFVADVNENRFRSRVREQFMGGVRSGVNGTPTFFINGARHDGSYDADSLLSAIQSML